MPLRNGPLHFVPSRAIMIGMLAVGLSAPPTRACRQKRKNGTRRVYHDHVPERDVQRQRFPEGQGWKVMRFANDDVFNDVEAVMRSIARQLGLTYAFSRRDSKRSGMMSENAPNNRLREEEAGHTARPTRPLPRPTSPEGR